MKTSKMYHYRITATSGAGECQSDDYTIMTGPLANGLQKPTVTTTTPRALCRRLPGHRPVRHERRDGLGAAYILDADGDYVWWFTIDQRRDRRASWTTPARTCGSTARTCPSGTRARPPRGHGRHRPTRICPSQFTRPEPPADRAARRDGRVLRATASNGCDDIKERAPNGTVRDDRQLPDGAAARPAPATSTTSSTRSRTTRWCSPTSTTTQVAKVKRTDGSTVWILNGGDRTTFTGDTWVGRRARHPPPRPDALLIFNNNSNATRGGLDGARDSSWIRRRRRRPRSGVHGGPASTSRSWATCSGCRTGTPSSATRPRGARRGHASGRCCRLAVAAGGLRLH